MLIDGIELSEGSVLTNLTVAAGAEFPSTATMGELFFHTGLHSLCCYTGSSWQDVGASAAGQQIDAVVLKAILNINNVDNTSDANKPVSTATTAALANKADKATTLAGYGITDAGAPAGSVDQDFAAKQLTVAGNILPTVNGTQSIGSPTMRFATIYVNEAMLSVNTLYLGDTPILGTSADTINIKADPGQSIHMQSQGTGSTLVTSTNQVQISTAGMNADVLVQATGTGSKVRFAGTAGVELASDTTITGNEVVTGNSSVGGNLTVTGNLTVNGTNTIVNTTSLSAKDNMITVNAGEVGSGVTSGKAGLQVDRGDLTDYQIVFDETDDMFKVGQIGQLETIASQNHVASVAAPIGHVGAGGVSHSAATTTVNGFMSSADKSKLDSIEAGATVSQVDSVAGRVGAIVLAKADVGLSNVDNTSDANKPVSIPQALANSQVQQEAYADATTKANAALSASAPIGHVGAGGSSHAVVTTIANGFMSSADKTKLDGLTTGVASVAGKTGVVTLTSADVGLGNVTNESKATMFTSPVFTGHMLPGGTSGTQDLGSAANRLRDIYTSDLNMSNGIGDYTIVEGEEDLFLYNNKSGKTFKFALIEVDPSIVPKKVQ